MSAGFRRWDTIPASVREELLKGVTFPLPEVYGFNFITTPIQGELGYLKGIRFHDDEYGIKAQVVRLVLAQKAREK